jgi:hypothetical protein
MTLNPLLETYYRQAASRPAPKRCPVDATKVSKWRQRAAQGERPKFADLASEEARSGNAQQDPAKSG